MGIFALANEQTMNSLAEWFASSGSTIIMILLIGAMFAIMIIPQRRREKKVKEMLASIKQGDRVRTIGGIYGTITSAKEDIVTISVGPDKVRLVFARGAIASVEDSEVVNEMEAEVKDVK